MTRIRRWHSYFGLFIAPSVLFFALTGALQLFNLHEAHGTYQPPTVIEKLSSVHKDQVFALGDHHDQPEQPASAKPAGTQPAGDADEADKPSTVTFILKGFFLFVALCLSVSTLLGMWIGLSTQRKTTGWWLLAAGALIPISLLIL